MYSSRERVLSALNHREADRIPIDLGGWQSGISFMTLEGVKKLLGVQSPIRIEEICQGIAQIDEEILETFNIDTRYLFPNSPPSGNPFEKGTDAFVDEWGISWARPASSHYYDMVAFPLSGEQKDFTDYTWPDPADILSREQLIRNWDGISNSGKAVCTSLAGCFEQATYVRGMEDFYMDAYINRSYFEKLLDKVLEIELQRYSSFFDAVGEHLDIVEFWGDLGTQDGPMISPDLYRRVIQPRERQLVDLVKDKTGAKAALHTCGAVFDFIPDIIDAGYEVLNPVQTTAVGMDPVLLKREFGQDITFWGAIDTQHTLPFGTAAETRDEVKRIIDILAPGGGFIFAPCHNIQAMTPPENVIAMFAAAAEHGVYQKTGGQ